MKPRPGEYLAVENLNPLARITRLAALAALLSTGCSESATASGNNNDASVDTLDVAPDTHDSVVIDTSRIPCWFRVEEIRSLGRGLRSDIVTRDDVTRFNLQPANESCFEELTLGVEPQDAGGRPTYVWGARVCIPFNGTDLCRDTQFSYTGGTGFKGLFQVGPVSISSFSGLPNDWVANNQPVRLEMGLNWSVRTNVDVDLVTPTMTLNTVVPNADGNIDISFTNSEAGYWGLLIANESPVGETVTTAGTCDLFSHDSRGCETGYHCTFDGNNGACLNAQRGGQVFNSGSHTVQLSFPDRGNYAARMFFVDNNGNPAAGATGWVHFTR